MSRTRLPPTEIQHRDVGLWPAGSGWSSRSRKTRRNTAATAAGGRAPAFDGARCKERNTVERCFSKLRQSRAVATRYGKRDCMYQATIDVASIRIWLRDPVP